MSVYVMLDFFNELNAFMQQFLAGCIKKLCNEFNNFIIERFYLLYNQGKIFFLKIFHLVTLIYKKNSYQLERCCCFNVLLKSQHYICVVWNNQYSTSGRDRTLECRACYHGREKEYYTCSICFFFLNKSCINNYFNIYLFIYLIYYSYLDWYSYTFFYDISVVFFVHFDFLHYSRTDRLDTREGIWLGV